MNVTISGATGLVGRSLLEALPAAGHTVHVLSRQNTVDIPGAAGLSVWNPIEGPPPRESLERADAIIHLAGENVAQRWTPEAKQRIRASRVLGTRHLVAGLEELPRRPGILIAASAVGYYGDCGDELVTEASPQGKGFVAEVCGAWERESERAASLGLRVVRMRIGIVLDPRGGALGRMLVPFRLGLGGRLGSGRQWMPWIHRCDLASMILHALEHPVSGVMNGVSPFPVRNEDFTRELARVLRRPALIPVPAFALKLVFGEFAGVVLESQRALPRTAEAAGFRLRFPQLGPALRDLFGVESR